MQDLVFFEHMGLEMRITRVINNNVVSSQDKEGKEVIIMGRGLAFQKKAGQTVDETKIEKIFRLESQDTMEQFKKLVENIPLEYLEVSNEIISYAKEKLGSQLNQSVYLTLTDHINFAMDRHKKNMLFQNALYHEIRRFYPEEFAVGMHALDLIEDKTGIRFPVDEAASIAFHLVNAEFSQTVSETWGMTRMLQDMMKILEEGLPRLPEESLYMDQLTTNLKFLVHRILLMPAFQGKDDLTFRDFIQNHCKKEYELAEKVRDYIRNAYQKDMTDSEQVYLAIHIKNVNDISQ